MTRQGFTLLLVCLLACVSASSKDSAALENDSQQTRGQMYASTGGVPLSDSFHLKGILISQNKRSALVNDHVLVEGERVGNAEIVEITESAVRIQVDSQLLSVHVGSTTLLSQLHKPLRTRQGRTPVLEHATTQHRVGPRQLTVKHGDTLSNIAERLLHNNITRNQMMLALFEENPHAFAGNINKLRADATLVIPDNDKLHYHAAEKATAEVVKQTDLWRIAHEESAMPFRLVRAAGQKSYGPVSNGETLSAIAVSIHAGDVTLNQTMIALFEANPQAFGESIHVLLAGTVLRIPDEHELRRQTPEIATAEVMLHTNRWQSPDSVQAQLSATHVRVLAASHERVHPGIPTPY